MVNIFRVVMYFMVRIKDNIAAYILIWEGMGYPKYVIWLHTSDVIYADVVHTQPLV